MPQGGPGRNWVLFGIPPAVGDSGEGGPAQGARSTVTEGGATAIQGKTKKTFGKTGLRRALVPTSGFSRIIPITTRDTEKTRKWGLRHTWDETRGRDLLRSIKGPRSSPSGEGEVNWARFEVDGLDGPSPGAVARSEGSVRATPRTISAPSSRARTFHGRSRGFTTQFLAR